MGTKKAKIDFLSLDMSPISKNSDLMNPLENFENLIKYIDGLSLSEKKETYEDTSQVVFLDEYKFNNNKFFLKFVSAKYNNVRDILDTEKMITVPQKKKTPTEGDMENTHIIIHFSPDYIDAYMEYSHFGARENKIFRYLNDKVKKMNENNDEVIDFEITYEYYFDKNFLDMLLNKDEKEFRKIELVCEDTSDPFLSLNSRAEKYKATIVYQPKDRGIPIFKSEIRSLYEDFNKKYSRIRIKNSKGATILDTDQLKRKEIVTVDLDSNDNIKTPSIFKEINKLIKKAHPN